MRPRLIQESESCHHVTIASRGDGLRYVIDRTHLIRIHIKRSVYLFYFHMIGETHTYSHIIYSLSLYYTVAATLALSRPQEVFPRRPLLSKPFWDLGAVWRSNHTSRPAFRDLFRSCRKYFMLRCWDHWFKKEKNKKKLNTRVSHHPRNLSK
jgi:hypothetical protein